MPKFFASKPIENSGFGPPSGRTLGRERRTVMLAELVATIGLAVSTIVAVTVLSVGIARASVPGGIIDNEGGLFVIALVLGILFIGMGGLTVLSLPDHQRHKKTHS